MDRKILVVEEGTASLPQLHYKKVDFSDDFRILFLHPLNLLQILPELLLGQSLTRVKFFHRQDPSHLKKIRRSDRSNGYYPTRLCDLNQPPRKLPACSGGIDHSHIFTLSLLLDSLRFSLHHLLIKYLALHL